MTRRRHAIATFALLLGAAGVTACGTEAISLDKGDRGNAAIHHGAEVFAQRCAGCHTLDSAGAQGSATSIKDRERVDGPNFNVRKEQVDQVLYAIRNGGFSGAIMPQNIVVGRDAQDVALFLSKYAGRQAQSPEVPTSRNQPAGGARQQRPGAQDNPQAPSNGTGQ